MPIKVGVTSVVRLYKRELVSVMKYRLNNTGVCPISAESLPMNPNGMTCFTLGEMIYAEDVNACYVCQSELEYVNTEVTNVYEPNLDEVIHRRVKITFNANGGSGGSTQTRTWDVENVVQPNNPSRSGYIFNGWATTSNATTPNVSFPFVAPQSDITRYAVWSLPPETATPTVGTPSCRNNGIRVSVTNNDSMMVEIRNNGAYVATLNPNITQVLNLYSIVRLPANYSISITAKATTKETSAAVLRTGTITLCPLT